MDVKADLFGNPLDPPKGPRGRGVTNDMDLVERVLGVAVAEGYVLVGVAEKVFRLGANQEITPAPGYEADVVHQLLDSKWLTKGGNHSYICGGYTGPGNSVLVPRATKQKVRLWRNLAPLNKSRKEHVRAVANDQ
jgi:hypothetical protein